MLDTTPLDPTVSTLSDSTAPLVGGLDPTVGAVSDATAPVLGTTLDPPPGPVADVAAAMDAGGHSMTPGEVDGDSSGIAAVLSAINPFDGGSLGSLQLLGTGYITWKIALFSAVLASLVRAYGNATSSFSLRLVAFTNVQLVRCGVVSPIVRLATAPLTAVSSALPAFSNALPARPTTSIRAAFTSPVALVVRRLQRPFPGLANSALSPGLGGDGTLMMRIGKVLGMLYAGFLAIWLWATRVRWNGR